MAQLKPVSYGAAVPVDSYGPGFFRVGGQLVHGGLMLWHGGQAAWAGYDDTAALLALAGEVDVVFVGTGAEIAHVPPGFRKALEDAGMGVEVMATPTACRTYNVLLSEGRRIAAALVPMPAVS